MAKRVWFTKEKFKLLVDDQVVEFTALGGNLFFGFVFVIMFLSGFVDVARVLFISIILFTGISLGIKYYFSRTRPNKVSLKHASVFEKMNDASFPSIHSGRAIILGYVVGPILPGYAKWFFYVAMIGIPISRIILKKHFWSDVIAGALIGFLVAYGVNLLI
jgi:undecaprenyl-diphosphatase|tara:strand:- start:481 stop:963 length:483 start_codon:yes stop_codon:yes gene_type:complete